METEHFQDQSPRTVLLIQSQSQVGLISANGIKVNASNFIETGHGLDKDVEAGKIGYNLFSENTLDIVGGGTTSGERNVNIYDHVIVNGNGTFSGSITANGSVNSESISSELITANGIKVNASNFIEMGHGLDKDEDAGTIQYGVNALEIVGAGTVAGNKIVELRDNVIIQGDLTVGAKLNLPNGPSIIWGNYSSDNDQTFSASNPQKWVTHIFNLQNKIVGASAYNTNNGIFTAPVAGLFTFEWSYTVGDNLSTRTTLKHDNANTEPSLRTTDGNVCVRTLYLLKSEQVQVLLYTNTVDSYTSSSYECSFTYYHVG